MPQNIKDIALSEKSFRDDGLRTVKINFKFPCEWTVLNIDDLKQILRLWIKGEEEKYPQEKGFKGRWMLFEEIKKVFEEDGKRC